MKKETDEHSQWGQVNVRPNTSLFILNNMCPKLICVTHHEQWWQIPDSSVEGSQWCPWWQLVSLTEVREFLTLLCCQKWACPHILQCSFLLNQNYALRPGPRENSGAHENETPLFPSSKRHQQKSTFKGFLWKHIPLSSRHVDMRDEHPQELGRAGL